MGLIFASASIEQINAVPFVSKVEMASVIATRGQCYAFVAVVKEKVHECKQMVVLNHTGSLEEVACSKFLSIILILWEQLGWNFITCFYYKIRVSYFPFSTRLMCKPMKK